MPPRPPRKELPLETTPRMLTPRTRMMRSGVDGEWGEVLVRDAGTGFEPVTFRL